jgi:hypothetical protein
MRRHLIPRFEWGGWSGDALTKIPAHERWHHECQHDGIRGGILTIQWLGLMIEIAAGKVS